MDADKKNYIDLKEEDEYPIASSKFCEEWISPTPPLEFTVIHKTIGGKGVVAKIEK